MAGAGPADSGPGRRPLPLGRRGGDGGKGHRHLKPWAGPVGGHWELCVPAGHSPPPVRWAPRSPAGQRLDELEGPGERAGTHLLPLPAWTITLPTRATLLNGTLNGHLLTVACLGDVSMAASTRPSRATNGHSLRVAPLGEGPLQCFPIAELH